MLFNQSILHLKQLYLDSTPTDLVRRVAEDFLGMKAHLTEIPRQWTPGGGSQNFIARTKENSCFIKAKHKSLLVESALESESTFSHIAALKNEYFFLCALSDSQYVPKVIGFAEHDEYLFLATEVLQPFKTINTFSPAEIVNIFKQIQDITYFLYSKNIIHTDIHENNICFRGSTPILIDFEEARHMKQSTPFENSLDVAGKFGIDNVGNFPILSNDSIAGLTCLNRLKKVFKRILRDKLPSYLAQCNFDCTSSYNLDTEQHPDNRIYQSVILPDITVAGQRPVQDQRMDQVRLVLEYAHAILGRRLNIVDLGSNMGMISFFCNKLPYARLVVGLEADKRYVEASNVLAFYNDTNDSVQFNEYTTGSAPYIWKTDVLLMLSVYHHIEDRELFLQELAEKNITCILGEFAVQDRYYPQRGSVSVEIEYIRKKLGFRYAEHLAMSTDYQRPIVAFHNGPSQSICTTVKDGSSSSGIESGLKTKINKSLHWLHTYSPKKSGVSISNKNLIPYPEVTGYFIPTLLQWGETDLATQYTHWLIDIQNPDGSFSAPGTTSSFVFDTGQIIRGLATITPRIQEASKALEKACEWIMHTASSNGRLALPTNINYWSLGSRGYVNEAINLYVLPGLITASETLNTPRYANFARRSLNYYIKNCDLTNFSAPNMLLHFYCYIQEALFDLGAYDICRHGMRELADRQTDKGIIPAYSNVSWICTPGLIQAALVWLKLEDTTHALPALRFANSLQSASGGFPGSVGEGAAYFPNEELSWAIKFWLDALALQTSDHASTAQEFLTHAELLHKIESPANILSENDIPVIRLEKGAIVEIERSADPSAMRYPSSSSPAILDNIAKSIPVLLDWGRRDRAQSIVTALDQAIIDQPKNFGAKNNSENLFILGNLIRAFRQPEVLADRGDSTLRHLCLQVLRRHRLATGSTPGLFHCFGELYKAGEILNQSSWMDCSKNWANGQNTLLDQCASPNLVLEAIGVSRLLTPELGLALLLRIATNIPFFSHNQYKIHRKYSELLLTLSWGALTLKNFDLGTTAFRLGASTLATDKQAFATPDKIFKGDSATAQAFLNALSAMQLCRFENYFPHFLDDIAPNDGRMQFVKKNLPIKSSSRVLDLGTAKGRYIRQLCNTNFAKHLFGQDIHSTFIEFMPQNIETKVGTILRTKWDNNIFDAVMICEVLEHCIDLPAAITELRRILSDGGTLIIVDKNAQRLEAWPGGLSSWEQWFDSGQLSELLRKNDFVITDRVTNLPYENKCDGLFFGIAAIKKKPSANIKDNLAVMSKADISARSYLTFDPRNLLGDSLGLTLYTTIAEAHLNGTADLEMRLYVKYLNQFPKEQSEHSPENFARLIESIAKDRYNYSHPVSALPEAFTYSNGVHRMAVSIALAIDEIPYLRIPQNNVSQRQIFRDIFSDTEFRWLLAQQQRLINKLSREQRLLCEMRRFITNNPDSFRDAPFSSSTQIKNCIIPYQGLEIIGLTGKRIAEKRFSIYKISDYLDSKMDVLETGCNCGFLSWIIAQHVKHVDAFDMNDKYIQLGTMLKNEYHTKNLRYFISKFETFKVNKQYDAVISCAVYGWVPMSFASFVERLDQWLKPGGILLFESHELIVHPEWKEQRALLTDRYEVLFSDYIDDVNHAFYTSEYREFLILKKHK
ncbi:MAG: methyltransferase domain-containing protein [Desulfomicrobium apsheronum]|nr:methyltransferase domain-containing protein [Desulfomicrobium apsheronum]